MICRVGCLDCASSIRGMVHGKFGNSLGSGKILDLRKNGKLDLRELDKMQRVLFTVRLSIS